MTVLGIDPGTATTGWAVVTGGVHSQSLISCGSIVTSKLKDQSVRLEEIYDEVCGFIKKYKPGVLAIEQLFFNNNLKTAMIVSQTHGVIRLAGQKLSIPTVEYTPLEIKMAITGYGRAEKKQIQYMVAKLLKLDKKVTQDDTADAIAVALVHCYNMNINNSQ